MPAATLALGQSSYQLLEVLNDPGDDSKAVAASKRASGASYSTDVRSLLKDGSLADLGIGLAGASPQANSNVNVFAGTTNLLADLGGGGDTLNLFANTVGAEIELDDSGTSADPLIPPTTPSGGGNDLLNALRSFTASSVFAGDGNDTIRIAGNADNSSFFLGGGNDVLSVAAASQGVYVSGDTGNDLIQFRGLITDGVVQAGTGNDTIQFFSGLVGTSARSGSVGPSASVDLYDGNDSLLIGGGGLYSNLEVSTGIGSDTVSLAGYFIDSGFYLGGNGADSVTLTSGSFNDSWISSSSTTGDTLVFGAGTALFNTAPNTGIFMGSGADSLVFGGAVTSSINAGAGDDTIIFGAQSAAYGTNLNLGSDTAADKIYFNMSLTDARINFASGMKITGQTSDDKLYIGYGNYTTYSWNSNNDSWVGTGGLNDTIKFTG